MHIMFLLLQQQHNYHFIMAAKNNVRCKGILFTNQQRKAVSVCKKNNTYMVFGAGETINSAKPYKMAPIQPPMFLVLEPCWGGNNSTTTSTLLVRHYPQVFGFFLLVEYVVFVRKNSDKCISNLNLKDFDDIYNNDSTIQLEKQQNECKQHVNKTSRKLKTKKTGKTKPKTKPKTNLTTQKIVDKSKNVKKAIQTAKRQCERQRHNKLVIINEDDDDDDDDDDDTTNIYNDGEDNDDVDVEDDEDEDTTTFASDDKDDDDNTDSNLPDD